MEKIFFPPHWRKGHSSEQYREYIFVLLLLLGYYTDVLLLLQQCINLLHFHVCCMKDIFRSCFFKQLQHYSGQDTWI